MTTVTFLQRQGRLIGFIASGHAGAGEAGEDIVCAAVSAVTQQAAIAAEEMLSLPEAVESDEESARLSVVAAEGGESWVFLLRAQYLFLTRLAEQYPRNLNVTLMEVE